MTFYNASFETVTLRFLLMMGVIIVAVMAGIPILAVLGLPIFLAAMLGLSFKDTTKKQAVTMNVRTSERTYENQKAA